MRKFTVVLSHWHLDHVAGTAAFADCEIIANRRTMQHLTRHKAAIEAGTHHGLPAIDPLILPTRLFDGQMQLTLGSREIRLIELNIHSDDATVIWLPAERILMAGDTLEDTVTYVGEPENFDRHIEDLERLWALDQHPAEPWRADVIGRRLFQNADQARRTTSRRCSAVHDPALRTLGLRNSWRRNSRRVRSDISSLRRDPRNNIAPCWLQRGWPDTGGATAAPRAACSNLNVLADRRGSRRRSIGESPNFQIQEATSKHLISSRDQCAANYCHGRLW